MTSQISTAIDVEFPVAGQDNDSQGFRDNFTVTKNSLETAKSEITDLQTNAAKLNADNNFNGYVIGNAQTNRLYGTVYNLSTATGINFIDYAEGELFNVSLTGNHSIRFIGWPQGKNETDVYAKVKVLVKNTTAPVTAGNFVVSKKYEIINPGTGTTWTSIGAADNEIGTQFIATGPGSGTGTAQEVLLVTFIDVIITGAGATSFEVGSTVIAADAWTPDGQSVYLSLMGDFSSSGAFLLASAVDTTLSNIQTNQILKYNGTKWVNSSSALSELTDVVISGSASGQALRYNGTNWVNSTISYSDLSGTPTIPSTLNSLTDVVISGSASGQALRYNGTNWVNSTISYSDLSNTPAADINDWKGTEQVSNAASSSLSKTAGYFNTGSTAETASLSAGTEGQIKVFVMDTVAAGGSMTVNVSNPGWGGLGTVTFNAIGQGCTLQYINSKWFCVGNNGATFA
jgi:hypothetical protein